MPATDYLEIANGNESAAAFCAAFIARAHLVDDIEDGDSPVGGDALIAGEVDWLVTLAGNQFFQQHKAALVPAMVMGINAWRSSNAWRISTDVKRRRASDVLKSFYHEVVYLVAFLTGGLEHMQRISDKYREYDQEET